MTNQFQQVSGMRMSVMPGARIDHRRDHVDRVSSEAMQNSPMLKNQSVWPSLRPARMAPTALSGG